MFPGSGLGSRVSALGAVDEDLHDPVAVAQRGLYGVGEPRARLRLHLEPVHEEVDVVLPLLVEPGELRELDRRAVYPGADEAGLRELRELLGELPLAAGGDRSEDGYARPLRELKYPLDHLRRALSLDRLAARGAVRAARPREEDAQVVVYLGGCAYGRAGVPRCGALLYGDGGGEPLDRIDIGLVHLAQELAGVGGERLDVAALTLRVYGVEGERRLSGAGEPGDDHEPVLGDRDVDVLEVVHPRAADDYRIARHADSPVTAPPAFSPRRASPQPAPWWAPPSRCG